MTAKYAANSIGVGLSFWFNRVARLQHTFVSSCLYISVPCTLAPFRRLSWTQFRSIWSSSWVKFRRVVFAGCVDDPTALIVPTGGPTVWSSSLSSLPLRIDLSINWYEWLWNFWSGCGYQNCCGQRTFPATPFFSRDQQSVYSLASLIELLLHRYSNHCVSMSRMKSNAESLSTFTAATKFNRWGTSRESQSLSPLKRVPRAPSSTVTLV